MLIGQDRITYPFSTPESLLFVFFSLWMVCALLVVFPKTTFIVLAVLMVSWYMAWWIKVCVPATALHASWNAFVHNARPGDVVLLQTHDYANIMEWILYGKLLPVFLPGKYIAGHVVLVRAPVPDADDVVILDSTMERHTDLLTQTRGKTGVMAIYLKKDKLDVYHPTHPDLWWVRLKSGTGTAMDVLEEQHCGKSFTEMTDNNLLHDAVYQKKGWIYNLEVFLRAYADDIKKITL